MEERLNLYATTPEGTKALQWAKKRWRTWSCNSKGHEPPKSASTLLVDILIHAMEQDAGKKKTRR
ncbi:MAG: hypothetical protein ACYC8W_07800 [Candidatus Tyrphobacter sp.]